MAHVSMAIGGELQMLALGRSDTVEIRRGKNGECTFHALSAHGGDAAASVDSSEAFLALIPWEESRNTHWALICPCRSAVCVNGVPVIGGIHILAHQDAIGLGDAAAPIFFLNEDPARAQPFPALLPNPVKCNLCNSLITEGQAAVRCPGCGQWYHQETGGKGCWTYRKKCKTCGLATSLDGTFSWTPAGL
mgnify:CR=1 FL=1